MSMEYFNGEGWPTPASEEYDWDEPGILPDAVPLAEYFDYDPPVEPMTVTLANASTITYANANPTGTWLGVTRNNENPYSWTTYTWR